MALLERTHVDEAEAERLLKERDDLLQVTERLYSACGAPRDERD